MNIKININTRIAKHTHTHTHTHAHTSAHTAHTHAHTFAHTHPVQTQGQWWSKRSTHRLQCLQCFARGGLIACVSKV